MSDTYWKLEELRYTDADDPFSIYCPACGGTGIDPDFDLYGIVIEDNDLLICRVCYGEGLLYSEDYDG